MIVSYPKLQGKWVWPFVEDLNSDTRADLILYEKDTGRFYVKFTDAQMLNDGSWDGWDWIIADGVGAECKDSLDMDYTKSVYGRPLFYKT